MKLICYREQLLASAQAAAQAVPTKEIKPVLQNLLLTARDGTCTLTATDLEVGVRTHVEGVNILEAGAVPPLLTYLAAGPDEEATLQALGADTVFSCARQLRWILPSPA